MQTKTFEVPTLYGDHHVLEVRRILLEIPGVFDVYVSSAFQVIEVTFEETKVNDLEIAVILDNAGYLGEWTIPVEVGAIVQSEDTASSPKPYFRHTEVYETSRQVVGFSQDIPISNVSSGRPLWPCPGMSPSRKVEE
jgi:copper chaperone CopZ